MRTIKIIFIVFAFLFTISCNNVSHPAKEEQVSSPVLLSNEKQNASCVSLTTDQNNNPIISWCEEDEQTERKYFFLAFYNKETNAFDKPVPVPIEQNTAIHEEGMPKIAVKGDGTIIAVYETESPTKENEWAGFVRYIVSADKGKTWTLPSCLHEDTVAGKSRSFAAITRLSDGEIGACWLDASFDYTKDGRPVKFAKTNKENVFSNEILVDSIACECCRTTISSNKTGRIDIVFRDIINDSVRDMSVCSSVDNGHSFSKAVSFSNDNWVVNGCPHNGPHVESGNGKIYATWFTGGIKKGVYYTELDENKKNGNKELLSASAKNIQMCLLSDNSTAIVYNEIIHQQDSVYSKIVLQKRGTNKLVPAINITTEKSHSTFPVIIADGTRLIIAWSENNQIYYLHLTD